MPRARIEILIFANPIAGRGRGEQIARRLETRLPGEGFAPRLFLERPSELDAQTFASPAHAAIVIGGDGTIRAVAERFIHAGMLVPLLVVPLGTANLLGRYLGIRWTLSNIEQQVATALRNHRILHLDAARANGRRLMLLMAGIGYDAQVINELHRNRRGPISFWDYFPASAVALYRFVPWRLRVLLDGREIFAEGPAIAFVGNLREYATFPILSEARPDDGLLDVFVVPCRSRAELLRLFIHGAAGEHVQAEGAVYQEGRHVRIESPDETPVQIDGDPAGHTPLDIDLLPVRLPFIVPA